MKNKNINVSLIICSIIGFFILPMILGGIYLYNLQGLTVRKNPDKSKETDIFEIACRVEKDNDKDSKEDRLDRWIEDNVRYGAPSKMMFDLKEDCQVVEYIQGIKDTKYCKYATIVQHAPKILVDEQIMSSSQKLVNSPNMIDERLKYGSFKVKNRIIRSYYILKNGEALQPQQKSIYDQYKYTVYNQIYVDNIIYYVEVNEKDYKLISKEEFEEKAYGFDQSTDLEKLIKKTSKIPERYVWFMLVASMLATVAIYYTYQNFKYGKHIFAFLETMVISAFAILAWYKFSIVFAIVAIVVDIILLKLVYKNIIDEIEFKPVSSWQFILLGYVIGVILNGNI